MDNGNPIVIPYKKINNYPENDMLIQILESVIAEGHFEFIECSTKYMLKYNRDFILSYLQRYAKGELNEKEIKVNENIRLEYIMDFAKNAIS